MPRQRKDPAARRAEILEKARQMIIENGHSSFRLEDLLEQLSLSKGGFYHHFKSVDEMLAGLITEDLEQDLQMIQSCSQVQPASLALQNLLQRGSVFEAGEPGILPFLVGAGSRELYIRLLEETLNEPIKMTVTQIFQSGIESGCFQPFHVPAAVEFFIAVNNHANRATILGSFNDQLGRAYHRLALQALCNLTGFSFSEEP